jgi:hypothetical protein
METKNLKKIIRTIYFYFFSLIGLSLIIIGSIQITNLALKTWIFKQADEINVYPQIYKPTLEQEVEKEKEVNYHEQELEYQKKQQKSNRQQTAANALSMILIGIPLYLYHWKIVQKNEKREMN